MSPIGPSSISSQRSHAKASGTPRRLEGRLLLGVSLLLLAGLWATYDAKTRDVEATTEALAAGTVLHLNETPDKAVLDRLLQRRFPSSGDRAFYADTLHRILQTVAGQGKPLANVGALQTRAYALHAASVEGLGGPELAARVAASYRAVGFSTPHLLSRERRPDRPPFPAAQQDTTGYRITGRVLVDERPLPEALVTLLLIDAPPNVRPDTLRRDTLRTGTDGRFAFTGLPPSDSLEVVVHALKPDLEVRRWRRTGLSSSPELTFAMQPHTMALFDGRTFRSLKPYLVVRSPEAFSRIFWTYAALLLGTFWTIHFFWRWGPFRSTPTAVATPEPPRRSIHDVGLHPAHPRASSSRGFRGDPWLLPLTMLLTGLGFLLMASLPDPLRDRLLMRSTIQAIVVGGLLMAVISVLPVQRLLRQVAYNRKAYLWLIAALFLSTLLLVFGRSPAGASAKVNLPLIGQPVELIKLSLLVFFAGYFAYNWSVSGERENRPWPRRLRWLSKLPLPQLRYAVPILSGVGLAVVFFIFQGDLGPALVSISTFLILYGLVLRQRWGWGWVGTGFGLVIGTFVVAYHLGAPAKLVNRVQMMLHPWNNVVYGGDHLAHSFWTYASGQFFGQGLGHGEAYLMPAAHTDMVLPALGEELGFLGVLVILGVYLLLFSRMLKLTLRRTPDISFFLMLGIVFSLAFQFILITGGSLGVLPLSGVVSPFLSHGRVALIVHLACMGLFARLSADAPVMPHRARPSTAPRESDPPLLTTARLFGRPLRIVQGAFVLCFVLLMARAAWIQLIKADDWLIRPTVVGQETRANVYNPRIGFVQRALHTGSIRDRNGIPLATNHLDTLRAHEDVYRTDLGLTNEDLTALYTQLDRRYYPLRATTFYLLGDRNRSLDLHTTGAALSADYDQLSALRGYDNYPRLETKVFANRHVQRVDTVVHYDYSALLPFLEGGTESRRFERFQADVRDVYLTIDARLQQAVTRSILQHVRAIPKLEGVPISAAVIDPRNGQVIASVTVPLPEAIYTNLAEARQSPSLRDLVYASPDRRPGSTIKVATAMAGYQALGDAADAYRVYVHGYKDRTNRPADWESTPERHYRSGSGPRGPVGMRQALDQSSNVFFASLAATQLGPELLEAVLQPFGFVLRGRTTNRRGQTVYPVLDTRIERLEALRPRSGNRNLEQVAFGQGIVDANPLAVARMIGTVAQAGQLRSSHWYLDEEATTQTLITAAQARRLASYLQAAADNVSAIKNLTGFAVAGKTGTGEFASRAGLAGTINDAWFTGFAPYCPSLPDDIPQVAVAVVVSRVTGTGGANAGPIAAAILQDARALGYIGSCTR